MRWTVHGERAVYESPWVGLSLVDVEIPGERRFEHHAVRYPAPAVGSLVLDRAPAPGAEPSLLLLWRHRFITDSWGWEVPAGRVEKGETAVQAAVRETLEETGWEPAPPVELTRYFPNNGSADLPFVLVRSVGARCVGAPSDPSESERIEWVPLGRARELVGAGQVTNGLSLTALLYLFAFGVGG